MRRTLPLIADAQCGVVTTGQAEAAGWTESSLGAAVAGGQLDRLWRGMYARCVNDDAEGRSFRQVQRAVGVALTHHDAHVTHLAGAALWRQQFWAPDPRACVTTATTTLSAAVGAHVHRCPIRPAESARLGHVRTTSLGRVVVDIAREFGTESGLVTADAALHSRTLTVADLAAAVGSAAGRPGVGAAREVLEFADDRAESVLESRSRWRIHRAGFPPPRPQAVVVDRDGRFVARVDFLWEELGVVGEADGRAEYRRDGGRANSEGRRREQLERLGLLYVPWGWSDLDPFEPIARELRAALTRAGSMPNRRRLWRVLPADAAA